jgi:hypothetical protein
MCQKYINIYDDMCVLYFVEFRDIFIGFILRSFLKKQHSSYIYRERKIHIKVGRWSEGRERERAMCILCIHTFWQMCVCGSFTKSKI